MKMLDSIRDDAIRAFLDHARGSPGEQWNVHKLHDAEQGWRIEWVVGGKRLRLKPSLARKLVRALEHDYREAFRAIVFEQRDTNQEHAMLEWFATFDRHAKECLALNKAKALPPEVQAA